MAPITGASSSILAYEREAKRLAAPAPRLAAKVVTRDAGVSLGPFSVRYTAQDYEFDLSGTGAAAAFADALDAAAQTRSLGETGDTDTTPNALTLRQALAGYNNTLSLPASLPGSMFTATA